MTCNEIQTKFNILNQQLKRALSTMQLNSNIHQWRQELLDLQTLCPHNDGVHNFSTEQQCPFCGKKFEV